MAGGLFGNPTTPRGGKSLEDLERENLKLRVKVVDLNNMLAQIPPPDSFVIDPDSKKKVDQLEKELASSKLDSSNAWSAFRRTAAIVDPSTFPSQVENSYQTIMDQVNHLSEFLLAPYAEDAARGKRVARRARISGEASGMIAWMAGIPDIATLARYDPYGDKVIMAIAMRWLHLEVFSRGLSGIFPRIEEVLNAEFLERSKPERHHLEKRRWIQYAYSSIMAHPSYQAARAEREKQLAEIFTGLFRFMRHEENMSQQVLTEIIRPAIRLQEQIAATIDEYTIEFPRIASPATPEFVSEFLYLSDALHCVDIIQHDRKVRLTPTQGVDLSKNFLPICSLTPVMIFRNIVASHPPAIQLTIHSRVICAMGDERSRTTALARIQPCFLYDLVLPYRK
ncbi:hypothetical protein F4781DRAFT_298185 [Annulohypoxylon bovei var. microspora]|nr:hypothetical protein F4781DRAFT_298185 [Annulohypoxylon bovei var. microspora]